MHHRIPLGTRHQRGALAAIVSLGLVAAACGSSSKATPTVTLAPGASTTAGATTTAGAATTTAAAATTTAAAATTTAGGASTTAAAGASTTAAAAGGGVTTAGISDAECAANKAAGPITYLSSFDFSASASILDVVVAKEKGYFDKMCLSVSLKPSFSTANYPLVAAGQAQFSSAGSYTEILNYTKDGASFVALADYGKTPVEALVVKDPAVTDLSQLKGKTIGVKGDIPPSIVAMLSQAGLKRGTDYKEILLDGFDPVAQLKQSIDALPVYKSNEPGQLDKAGVKYALFDPSAKNIPGTFGLIYTSTDFAKKNPTATKDFVRAALKGMQDALTDPTGAVALSVKEINAAGNQNYLTQEGETFRWSKESALVKQSAGSNPIGIIDPAVFKNEVAAYVAAGSLKSAPNMDGTYDADLAKGLYDSSGALIWPAS